MRWPSLVPPAQAVWAAEKIAARSPCSKSKRGVVVYAESPNIGIHGEGFNGQPAGFVCDGSARCREACGKLCVHAEVRAIRSIPARIGSLSDLHMLHVKIGDDDRVVPGGAPSCWQCSREILDCARLIAGIWLLEKQDGTDIYGAWRYYTPEEFHRATLEANSLEPQ